jgi:succinate dehydrogenase / fumarate reductase flavoprotein subunit
VGIITRNLETGAVERHAGHAVLLTTGGYSNVYYLSTNAKGSNVTAAWRAHKRGALFANPCFTQIHPTCIPASGDYQSKLTLMSESLRNDGRIWVPKDPKDARAASQIPESDRDYFLERKYPSFGNLVPRDVAARNCKSVVDEGRGVGPQKNGVYLDFADSINRLGKKAIEERYGNLFEMYEKITGENPYEAPMRIYPAPHYTMGGLWVDYNLMSNLEGLFVLGEANFSDHGANRLGASALMQGLADGYFVIPYTLADYLAGFLNKPVSTETDAFRAAQAGVEAGIQKFLSIKGRRTADSFHRELGRIVWDYCGIARTAEGLQKALQLIPALREQFWSDLLIPGGPGQVNQELEKAARVADYFELAELMCRDALERNESAGGHLREEHQTPEGEALRNDEEYAYVAAWEYNGAGGAPTLHKEPLQFETVKPSQRSYK